MNDKPKNQKFEKNTKKEQKNNYEIKENEEKIIANNTVTINQIGELSRYPEAMEIDGMECE